MKEISKDYKSWLSEIKIKILSAQLKAAVVVNSALIEFYWNLGKEIVEKQESSDWGDKILDNLSSDLQAEFEGMKGLSITNLKYCKRFYLFYREQVVISQQAVDQLEKSEISIGQQPVDQLENNLGIREQLTKIPWGHNIQIFTKSKSYLEADFYREQTQLNNWSRDVLALQIKSDLYKRQGNSISNFETTLPKIQSELAQQTIKDPYIFDFLSLTSDFKEKDLESQLIKNVTRFLLELGKGFAFVGQQYQLEVGESSYYLDLLFYHIKLKCYVVIELKNTKFIPEYAGKLNFYLSAVDSKIKSKEDKQTIGILLCRDKNNIETEFALRDMNKPMGVSEFQLTEVLPENLKSSLPTIEEIEKELQN